MDPNPKLVEAFLLAAILACGGAASAQDSSVRAVGETIPDFARRTLPPDLLPAHPALEGTFGPPGRNLLILAWPRVGGPVTAWVLVPQKVDPNQYARFVLPKSEAMHGYVGVEAVLFANADRDPENEILVLCSQMTGIGPTGARPWYETFVYDWDGARFVLLDSVREKLFNLATAQAVRKKLGSMGLDIGPSRAQDGIGQAGPHVGNESGEALAWIAERTRNAKAQRTEIVRMPVVRRSLGWGCDCPETYIGLSPLGNELGDDVWLSLSYAPEVRRPKNGEVIVAEGSFTGRQVEQNFGEEGIYKLWEFHVLKTTPHSAFVEVGHDAPDDHLYVVRASGVPKSSQDSKTRVR